MFWRLYFVLFSERNENMYGAKELCLVGTFMKFNQMRIKKKLFVIALPALPYKNAVSVFRRATKML